MPPIPKPVFRHFAVGELAFFWNPRCWVPDIVERFGDRTGSSDIRDAIIEVDDEGGLCFLHWYPDRGAWGLTDKGKQWVSKLVSSREIARERDWQPSAPPPANPTPLGPSPDHYCNDCDVFDIEPHEHPELAKPETREEELARLAAEQGEDDT